MRVLLFVGLLALVGCGKMRSAESAEEAKVYDVLKAYSQNPANGDQLFQGKRLRMEVPGVKISRDGPDTIATHSPGYLTPARHAQFFFVSETEAATVAPGKTYTITGRCEGLNGNVVVFRDCTAAAK